MYVCNKQTTNQNKPISIHCLGNFKIRILMLIIIKIKPTVDPPLQGILVVKLKSLQHYAPSCRRLIFIRLNSVQSSDWLANSDLNEPNLSIVTSNAAELTLAAHTKEL
jgi:hypothetical protein